jgi:hypothetical protein
LKTKRKKFEQFSRGWLGLKYPTTTNSKTSNFNFFKTSSKLLQNFFKTSSKLLQNFFKTSSKLLQNFFKTSSKLLQTS